MAQNLAHLRPLSALACKYKADPWYLGALLSSDYSCWLECSHLGDGEASVKVVSSSFRQCVREVG